MSRSEIRGRVIHLLTTARTDGFSVLVLSILTSVLTLNILWPELVIRLYMHQISEIGNRVGVTGDLIFIFVLWSSNSHNSLQVLDLFWASEVPKDLYLVLRVLFPYSMIHDIFSYQER